jgi:uncharacterized protein YjiS (DUF1127 family)
MPTKLKDYLIRLFNAFIKNRQASADRKIAMMHLSHMSNRELRDIGIGRCDIRNVVDGHLKQS